MSRWWGSSGRLRLGSEGRLASSERRARAGAFFGLHPQPQLNSFFYSLGTLMVMVAVSFFLLRTHIAPNRTRARQY